MEVRKTTLYLICIPLTILLFLEAGVLWIVIKSTWTDYSIKLDNFKWTIIGIIAFMIIRYLIIKLHWPFSKGTGKANLELLETDIHERIHQFVALCLGRRLSSIHVEQHSGVVYSSGSEVSHLLVALAPYCMPMITLIFVIARVMIKLEWLWFYDMVIGFSIGFHGVCIYKDTKKSQPDINQYPLHFSYLYIATFLLLNITIILVSIGKGLNIVETIKYLFCNYWDILRNLLL